METNTPAVSARAVLNELKRRRSELDAAIKSMETVMALLDDAAPATERPVLAPSDQGTGKRDVPLGPLPVRPSRRNGRADLIRRAFSENPAKVWDAESLAQEIGEDVNELTLKGIHAVLSRERDRGRIEWVQRGMYRLKNTSGPDAGSETGPEGDVTTSGVGGDANAPDGHVSDHHHGETGRNDDRGDRPVVTRVTP